MRTRDVLTLTAALTAGTLAGCGGEAGDDTGPDIVYDSTPAMDETGHLWVDDKSGEHCYIDMDHILDGSKVKDTVSGNTADTACDEGARIRSGQVPGNYNEYLALLRGNWDEFMTNVAQTMVDGQNENITNGSELLQGDDFAWVTRIGNVAVAGESVTIDLFGTGSQSGEYGPDSCSIDNLDQVRTLGEAVYDGREAYEVAIILDPGYGAQCRSGDVILVPSSDPAPILLA